MEKDKTKYMKTLIYTTAVNTKDRAIDDLDIFDTTKIMWGSDWPVLTMAEKYENWNDKAHAKIPNLSNDEKKSVGCFAPLQGDFSRLRRDKIFKKNTGGGS